jgi:hypothetical protein
MYKVSKNIDGDTIITIRNEKIKEVNQLMPVEKIHATKELLHIMSREEIRQVFACMTVYELKNIATNLHGEIYARLLG